MNRLRNEQQRRNQLTRDCWGLYAEHRQRVTALLLAARSADVPQQKTPDLAAASLWVLGAGNCNDLDLARLLASVFEIHLVNLDGEALAVGVAAQQLAGDARISRHGGVDLTGLLDRLSSWSPDRPPDVTDVDAALHSSADLGDLSAAGPFDVVASVCLLSQLLEAANRR